MDRRLSSNLLQFCQFVDSDPFLGANSADAPIASRQSACVTDVLGSLTAGRGLPVGSSSPRAWGLAALRCATRGNRFKCAAPAGYSGGTLEVYWRPGRAEEYSPGAPPPRGAWDCVLTPVNCEFSEK
jgi:hypothetical protein